MSALTELLVAIKDTPIPLVLVLAGVAFIALSLVRKVGTVIEADPANARSARWLGLIFLIAGVVLSLIPQSNSSSPAVTPVAPTLQPTDISTPITASATSVLPTDQPTNTPTVLSVPIPTVENTAALANHQTQPVSATPTVAATPDEISQAAPISTLEPVFGGSWPIIWFGKPLAISSIYSPSYVNYSLNDTEFRLSTSTSDSEIIWFEGDLPTKFSVTMILKPELQAYLCTVNFGIGGGKHKYPSYFVSVDGFDISIEAGIVNSLKETGGDENELDRRSEHILIRDQYSTLTFERNELVLKVIDQNGVVMLRYEGTNENAKEFESLNRFWIQNNLCPVVFQKIEFKSLA